MIFELLEISENSTQKELTQVYEAEQQRLSALNPSGGEEESLLKQKRQQLTSAYQQSLPFYENGSKPVTDASYQQVKTFPLIIPGPMGLCSWFSDWCCSGFCREGCGLHEYESDCCTGSYERCFLCPLTDVLILLAGVGYLIFWLLEKKQPHESATRKSAQLTDMELEAEIARRKQDVIQAQPVEQCTIATVNSTLPGDTVRVDYSYEEIDENESLRILNMLIKELLDTPTWEVLPENLQLKYRTAAGETLDELFRAQFKYAAANQKQGRANKRKYPHS